MRIKGLDYIRLLGIFLVVFYHLFSNVLPGGFLGVNVLFVLSGFLISFHLLDEIYGDGDIDLKKFYYKRFIRIFPPLLLMIFLTNISAFFIKKDFTVGYFDQFISALSFNYNIFEIIRGGSYEGQFIKSLFMPTWSLAIEVHFYILWPLFLSFLNKIYKDEDRFKKRFSASLMKITLLFYLLSYSLMVNLVLKDKNLISFVYFFDLSRMGSFVLGSFLACFVKRFSFKKIPYLKPSIGFSLFLIIISFFFSYNNKLTYSLGFFLADLTTVILILIAYSNKDLEERKIIQKLSAYSYGIFLFHWPVFVIVTSFIKDWWWILISLFVTSILVLFNYYVFENLFKKDDFEIDLKIFGKKKFSYDKYKIYIQSLVGLVLGFTIFSGYFIDQKADNMIEIEKTIYEKSIKQDIDKIKFDKAMLDRQIKKEIEAEKFAPITVIADSVLLGNREMLQENIENLYVNAEGSRPLESASNLIKQMQKEGSLGTTVVIALGTNAIKNPEESLKEIIKTLPKKHKLIFVTCFDDRFDHPHKTTKAMKKLAEKYDFITIMDWEKEAMAHPEYYKGTDGVHFYREKAANDAYLKLLKKAIDESIKKEGKK